MMQFLDSHPNAREKLWNYLLPLKKDTVNYYIPEYMSLLEMQRFPLLKLCLQQLFLFTGILPNLRHNRCG